MPNMAAAASKGDVVGFGADTSVAPLDTGARPTGSDEAARISCGPTSTPSAGVRGRFSGGGAPGTELPGAGKGWAVIVVPPSVTSAGRRRSRRRCGWCLPCFDRA
jgi:hypothetical protein